MNPGKLNASELSGKYISPEKSIKKKVMHQTPHGTVTKRRIKNIHWLRQQIYSLYDYSVGLYQDKFQIITKNLAFSPQLILYTIVHHKYRFKSITDLHWLDLNRAVQKYKNIDWEVKVFHSFLTNTRLSNAFFWFVFSRAVLMKHGKYGIEAMQHLYHQRNNPEILKMMIKKIESMQDEEEFLNWLRQYRAPEGNSSKSSNPTSPVPSPFKQDVQQPPYQQPSPVPQSSSPIRTPQSISENDIPNLKSSHHPQQQYRNPMPLEEENFLPFKETFSPDSKEPSVEPNDVARDVKPVSKDANRETMKSSLSTPQSLPFESQASDQSNSPSRKKRRLPRPIIIENPTEFERQQNQILSPQTPSQEIATILTQKETEDDKVDIFHSYREASEDNILETASSFIDHYYEDIMSSSPATPLNKSAQPAVQEPWKKRIRSSPTTPTSADSIDSIFSSVHNVYSYDPKKLFQTDKQEEKLNELFPQKNTAPQLPSESKEQQQSGRKNGQSGQQYGQETEQQNGRKNGQRSDQQNGQRTDQEVKESKEEESGEDNWDEINSQLEDLRDRLEELQESKTSDKVIVESPLQQQPSPQPRRQSTTSLQQNGSPQSMPHAIAQQQSIPSNSSLYEHQLDQKSLSRRSSYHSAHSSSSPSSSAGQQPTQKQQHHQSNQESSNHFLLHEYITNYKSLFRTAQWKAELLTIITQTRAEEESKAGR